MTVKTRVTNLEKEVEKQEPEEPYVTEISDDGHTLIGRRGKRVVIRLHYPNMDLREL